MDWFRYKTHFVVAAAVLVIAAPPILFDIYGNAGLQAASIVTSGLLSLALIVLYFQQYNVLDRQTELMEQEFESQIALPRRITAEEDTIYINLGNMGRGTIRYVDLKSEIISDTGPVSVKPGLSPLSAIEDGSKSIPGFCDIKEFKGTVKMLSGNGEDRRYPFRYFSDELVAAEIEKCTIRLTLEMIDETQQSSEDHDEFEIAEQELDLGEIVEHEIPSEDGETKTIKAPQSNTLSEAIKPKYPQDIIPRDSPFFD
ncbi:MAG TPA: hypothetical protein VFJ06_13700 [Halococcus sp.]|nr:hypothetical protein [Halococcus sp.]